MTLILSLLLVGLGIAFRLTPHAPNYLLIFSPIALALYAGARVPKRWGWLVPLTALIVTDLVMTWNTPYRDRLWAFDNFVRYATVLGVVFLGSRLMRMRNPLGWVAAAGGASLLFFFTTNLAVWASPAVMSDGLPLYPRTWAGLVTCFEMALPFFRNSLTGDVSSTLMIFAADYVVRRVASRAGESTGMLDPITVRSR